jgi:Nif-specific regulatory protein
MELATIGNNPGARGSLGQGALELLFDISQKLDTVDDVGDVVQPVLDAIAEHLSLLRATITLLNRETREIAIDAAYGLSDHEKMRGRYQLGEGVTGQVVATGRPAVVPRISEAPVFLDRTGARRGSRIEDISFLCVPIRLSEEVIGALSADRIFTDDATLEEDLRVLSVVATMIANAVALRRVAHEEAAREEDRTKPAAIIGNSKAMGRVFEMINQVSRSDATVLIRGESGVGKELVAEAIHHQSRRAEKPLIKVNCAALPATVLESELFGHERGAFTGAVTSRKGRFELADGGTIFLDEIGDFSPATQITLLRILQQREFERVGGTETIKTDVRIIAATNRDLEALIASGGFRHDLYYRLNVFPIHVPSLKERRTDIPMLVDYFVEKYRKLNGKEVRRVSTPAIDMLMSYHWPGNVRELENCIERAVLLTNEGVIHSHHLPPTLQTAEATGTVHKGTLDATLDAVERDLIQDALKTARGNVAKAARSLGVTERIMGLRVRKHGIDARRYRIRG